MKVTYIVSMFPCWSETFILNELVSHRAQGVELDIYSLKPCHEKLIHDQARGFVPRTLYPHGFGDPRHLLAHLRLFLTSPLLWLSVLLRLLTLKAGSGEVKLKGLLIFLIAAQFIHDCRQRRPEHLHAHFATYPALLAWLIHRFTGISYSFTAHAHDIYVDRTFLALTAAAAATVVTISEFNRRLILEQVPRLDQGRVAVVHCGIDVGRFRFGAARGTVSPSLSILSVGRLSGIKGFPFLLQAMKLLKGSGVPFHCTIVGDGPQRAELESMLRDLDLAGRVHLAGSRSADQVAALMEQADLFVLACSRDPLEGHDGIPVVFMEAMACGVPVIGTALSGIPELIRHQETGLCAVPHDPVSLMEQVEFYLEHPAEMERIRLKARELVQREFNIESNAEQLRGLFLAALPAPAQTARDCTGAVAA